MSDDKPRGEKFERGLKTRRAVLGDATALIYEFEKKDYNTHTQLSSPARSTAWRI